MSKWVFTKNRRPEDRQNTLLWFSNHGTWTHGQYIAENNGWLDNSGRALAEPDAWKAVKVPTREWYYIKLGIFERRVAKALRRIRLKEAGRLADELFQSG